MEAPNSLAPVPMYESALQIIYIVASCERATLWLTRTNGVTYQTSELT